jgi:hypothetical protein
MYYVIWVDMFGHTERSGGFYKKEAALETARLMRERGWKAHVEDGHGNVVKE